MKLFVDVYKRLKGSELNITFETEASILGILGASGCGKSMLLKCIAGVETPDYGRIQIGERVLFDHKRGINLPPQKRKVGLLFQQYALFPHWTVHKNLTSVSKDQQFISELLHRFHLTEVKNNYPAQLSGGQKQRTALARVLASRPEILLLDEPFSALDTSLQEELQLELQQQLADFDGNTLIVSHSLDELYRLCPDLGIITEKENLFDKTAQLFLQPKTLEAARLTGCKNIFRSKRIDAHTVKVDGLKNLLQVAVEVPSDCQYIGIRAHDFNCDSSINTLSVQYIESRQTPFEQNVWFVCEGMTIWWKTNKQMNPEKINTLSIAPTSILVLR